MSLLKTGQSHLPDMQLDFSIIIPAHDRPGQLAACVTALAELDYPRDRFEVIIVDDGSSQPVDSAISLFCDRICIRVYRQGNAGPGPARNAGALQAGGRVLAFTDDDCTPRTDWLKTLAARYASTPDPAIVGGSIVNALEDNPYATASQFTVSVGYAFHNSDPEHARFFTTSNLAVPADRFRELGGFDESFGTTASEDRELCGRWQHRGYRMIYAPEVVVNHAHPLTLSTFFRQHLNYGRGAVRLQQARARQEWQVYAPDPNYYRDLLRGPFNTFPFRQAVGISALIFASQAAAGAGMLLEWLRQRSKPLQRTATS